LRKTFRKTFGPRRIKVKSDGITTTMDHTFNRNNALQKKLSARYWAGARNISMNYVTQQLGVTPGNQNYTSFQIFSIADMKTALTTAGQQPGSSVGNQYNTARSFWTDCNVVYSMTNSSNGNMEVDIYHYICKESTTSSVATLFKNGVYDESSQIAQDLTINWGVTPLDSDAVGQYYKLKKITALMLTPGQSHIQKVTIHKNMPLSNELLTASEQGDLYLRGWSESVVFVARGMPVSSTTAGVVTSNTAFLNIISTERYQFKYITDNKVNFAYTSDTIGQVAGNVYNQGSGAASLNNAI